jgi:hypothetical protein
VDVILTAFGQRHQDSAPDHEGQQQERGTSGESASGETGWRNFAQGSKQSRQRSQRRRQTIVQWTLVAPLAVVASLRSQHSTSVPVLQRS